MPDGLGSIEEAMPEIRKHFETLYPAFSVESKLELPAATPQEVQAAVRAAIDDAVAQVVTHLRRERAGTLAALVACEYKAAYFRRNPNAA
jgi:hypothetical protein